MLTLLLAAVVLLVLSVSVYVFLRRGRQGGLAGGSGAASPPCLDVSGSKFSVDEVAIHNGAEDLWLIINGKVYDVTEYFLLHPGGEAILRNAGRDSTVGFSGTQHPDRVWDMVCVARCSRISVL